MGGGRLAPLEQARRAKLALAEQTREQWEPRLRAANPKPVPTTQALIVHLPLDDADADSGDITDTARPAYQGILKGKFVSTAGKVGRALLKGRGPELETIPLAGEDATPVIVKTKQFAVKPMTAEEAVLQLELIGHDFFVFQNAETTDINVLYRRRDGNYGLIEPQV